MSNPKASILIVEDDQTVAADLEKCLVEMGYAVSALISEGHAAEETAGNVRPDIALVDLGLQGNLNGPQVGDRLRGGPGVPVVYLTDVAEGDLFDRAQATNQYGYVLKPFDARQLDLNIRAALCLYERESRNLEIASPSGTIHRRIEMSCRFDGDRL